MTRISSLVDRATLRSIGLLAAGVLVFGATVAALFATGILGLPGRDTGRPATDFELGARHTPVDGQTDFETLRASPQTLDDHGVPDELRITDYLNLDRDPEVVGENFISMLIPDGNETDLRFVSFGASGVNWLIGTNPSCVGTVIQVDEQGFGSIVILDSARVSPAPQAGQNIPTVASKFNVTTGEMLWGPQPVVGSEVGLGMLFLANPTLAMQPAEQQEFEVFNTFTGEPVNMPTEVSTWKVLYENAGHVLLRDGDNLRGLDVRGDLGAEAWNQTIARPAQVLNHQAQGTLVPVLTDEVLQILDITTGQVSAELPAPGAQEASDLDLHSYRDATGDRRYFMYRVSDSWELAELHRDSGQQAGPQWELKEQATWPAPGLDHELPRVEYFSVHKSSWYVQGREAGYVLHLPSRGEENPTELVETAPDLRVPSVWNSAGIGIAPLGTGQPYAILEPTQTPEDGYTSADRQGT